MGQGSSRVVVGQVSHLSVEYEQLICHSRGHHLPLELPAGVCVCVRGGGWDTQPADLGPPLQFAEYIPVWPMHPSQCGPCIPASVAHTSQPVWPIHPSQCGPYIPVSVAHASQPVWPMPLCHLIAHDGDGHGHAGKEHPETCTKPYDLHSKHALGLSLTSTYLPPSTPAPALAPSAPCSCT